MRYIVVLLFLFLCSCSGMKAPGGSSITELAKRVRSANYLSEVQKDTLLSISDDILAEWELIKDLQLEFYKGFVEIDRQYTAEEDSIRSYFDAEYATYRKHLKTILELRYSMRSHLDEDQWRKLTATSRKERRE